MTPAPAYPDTAVITRNFRGLRLLLGVLQGTLPACFQTPVGSCTTCCFKARLELLPAQNCDQVSYDLIDLFLPVPLSSQTLQSCAPVEQPCLGQVRGRAICGAHKPTSTQIASSLQDVPPGSHRDVAACRHQLVRLRCAGLQPGKFFKPRELNANAHTVTAWLHHDLVGQLPCVDVWACGPCI